MIPRLLAAAALAVFLPLAATAAAPSTLGYGLVVTGGAFQVSTTGTNVPTLNGARIATTNDLTNLNASALSSGTVPLARLSGITSNQIDAATDAAYRSGGGGGGDLTALSNGVAAVGLVASNALPKSGGVLTGSLDIDGNDLLGVTAVSSMGGTSRVEIVGSLFIDGAGNAFEVGVDGAIVQNQPVTNRMSAISGSFSGDGAGLTNLVDVTNRVRAGSGGNVTVSNANGIVYINSIGSGGGGSSVTTSVHVACDWFGFRRDSTNDNLGIVIGSALDSLSATNREAYYAVVTTTSNANQSGHALATVIVPTGHGDSITTNLALWAKDSQAATSVVFSVLADSWGSVTVTQSVGTSRTKILIPWTGILTNVLAGDRIEVDARISMRSTNASNQRLQGFERAARFER